MIRTAYKVLGPRRRAFHGGTGVWPVPGKWLGVKGALVPCSNGLHLCAREHLVLWLGPAIWEAEYEGECIDHGDKLVVRRARLVRQVETWNDRTARLFAADCAERVLPLFESQRPGDTRPREAIAAARSFARGEITAAAMDFAGAAAWAAARVAAWSTSDAARDSAWAAARAAAWAAAWDAAWAVARNAALATERAWQTERLWQYIEGEIR